MKRAIIFLLACFLMLSAVGCSAGKPADEREEQHVLVDTSGMTDYQKAIVITAESYYLRGSRTQYDHRSTTADRKPEDYTTDYWGYHNCSGFVFDVYYNGLGFDFNDESARPITKHYITNRFVILKETPEEADFTEKDIEKKAKEFKDTLQPGDIIVTRNRGGQTGHAMLYVGNGYIIHSDGSNYSGYEEVREEFGTYRYVSVDELLMNEESFHYLFDKNVYVILRPLNGFDGDIPEDTLCRMGIMRGIMAEKLCSEAVGHTVNPGDQLTYTFHVENHSDQEKTLTVTDYLPDSVTYLSGAQNIDENTLTWEITLLPDKSTDISYTVEINSDAKVIVSDSYIEKVAVNCPDLLVAGALTEEQQQAVLHAYEANKDKATGVKLANLIYQEAIGYDKFENLTVDDLLDEVFVTDEKMQLNESGRFYQEIAPRLYGGTEVVEEFYRIRLLQERNLMAGDLIAAGDLSLTEKNLYLFDGENLINLQTCEIEHIYTVESFTGMDCFAVIRPAMGA